MQFKGVMDEVKKRLTACLEKGPATCYDAEIILLGAHNGNGSPGGSKSNGSNGGSGSGGGDSGLESENTLCKGWMEKTPQETSGNFFRSASRDKWQPRYFVLTRTSPVRCGSLCFLSLSTLLIPLFGKANENVAQTRSSTTSLTAWYSVVLLLLLWIHANMCVRVLLR